MRKFIKKISSIVAATLLTMTFSSGAGVFAASTEYGLGVGEEGLLRHLNIMSEESAKYDEVLTRGKLAHIAAKVSNAVEYTSEETRFYDVPATHEYFRDIHALVEAEVLSGDGNGYFRPDDAVTEAEVSKVFSVILGYRAVGYFDSYTKAANFAGYADGINLYDGVTYGEGLQLAYNVLHCEMFEPITFGENPDSVTFQLQKDYLAIERYHGMVKQTGRMEGCCGTTLTRPNEDIEENKVLINDKIYNCENGDQYLGQQVVFYTGREKTGEADNNISFLFADQDNDVITIQSEDIIGKNGSKFEYWSNDKVKEIKLAAAPDVIYNGVAEPSYAEEDLIPGAGSVSLIDYNDDKLYDVIMVDSYSYIVLKTVDTENNVLYGRYPEVTIGSIDREDTVLTIMRGDMKALPRSIKDGSVLAVRATKNKTGILKIYADMITNANYGTVETISDNKIVVAGVEYERTKATTTDGQINVGDNVNVYTHNGRCAVILHPANDSFQVGYLADAQKITKGFSSTLEVRIVDTNRNLLELKGDNKIVLDNRVVENAGEVLAALESSAKLTYNKSEYPYAQLVRYRLNNDGLLTHLDTITEDKGGNIEGSLRLDVPKTSLMYSSHNTGWFDNKTGSIVFTAENTALGGTWVIPDNGRDEPEWFTNGIGDGEIWTVEGYNVDDEYKFAEYVVSYMNKPINVFSNGMQPGIVTGVDMTINEEGDIVRKVGTIGANGTRYHTLDESLMNLDIKVGDLIRWRSDQFGKELFGIETFYHAGNVPSSRVFLAGSGNYSYQRAAYMTYGTPLFVKDGYMGFTTSISDDDGGVASLQNRFNFKVSGASVFIYDTEDGEPKVESGSLSNLVTYEMDKNNTDHVVIYSQSGNVKLVYIIK